VSVAALVDESNDGALRIQSGKYPGTTGTAHTSPADPRLLPRGARGWQRGKKVQTRLLGENAAVALGRPVRRTRACRAAAKALVRNVVVSNAFFSVPQERRQIGQSAPEALQQRPTTGRLTAGQVATSFKRETCGGCLTCQQYARPSRDSATSAALPRSSSAHRTTARRPTGPAVSL
jgi:hypothetical protein